MNARSVRGFTLIEMMVALAIVALGAGLATVAFGVLLDRPQDSSWSQVGRLRAAQRSAVFDARPVLAYPDSDQTDTTVLFLPDGRAVGSGVDPLTGRVDVRP